MKTKQKINQHVIGKNYRWLASIICLLMVFGLTTRLKAQDCLNSVYTYYEAEKLATSSDTKTSIKLPFKGAKNVKRYEVKSLQGGLTLTDAANDITMTEGKGYVNFEVSKDGRSLPAGVYCFEISMFSANECLNSKVFAVNVKGKPVLTLDPHNPLCSADDVNVSGTIAASEVDKIEYSWKAEIKTSDLSDADKALITFETTGNDLAYTAGLSLISSKVTNGIKKPIVITYAVTPVAYYTTPRGSIKVAGDPQSIDVTVYPALDLVCSADQTICSGNILALELKSDLTGGENKVSWTSLASNLNINGNTNGGPTDFIGSSVVKITDQLFNTGSASGTVTYTVTQNFEVCEKEAKIVVTVNPTPDVVLSDAVSPVCNGSQGSVNIASTKTGVTYDITIGTDNANVTGQLGATDFVGGVWNTGNLSLKAGVTEPQTIVYTVTPKIGTCQGTSASYSVTINPTPVITLTNPLAEICNGEAGAVDITTSITGANVEYEYVATPNANLTLSGNWALDGTRWTSPKLTNNTGSLQVQVYTITPKIGTCAGTAQEYSVTVVPTIDLDMGSAPAAVCSEDQIANVSFSSPKLSDDVKANIEYEWTMKYDGTQMEIQSAAGVQITGEGTADATATGKGTFPEIVITNLSDNVLQPTVEVVASYKGKCSSEKKTFTLTINPKPVFELGE